MKNLLSFDNGAHESLLSSVLSCHDEARPSVGQVDPFPIRVNFMPTVLVRAMILLTPSQSSKAYFWDMMPLVKNVLHTESYKLRSESACLA